MIHLGDITEIDGRAVPAVDVVTGGSPCQNLSVAGNRKGLNGDQSVLLLEQIRIVKEMREAYAGLHPNEPVRPRYMVWENVPGAFSSNRGADFRKVLEETARIIDQDAVIPRPPKGKWSTAGAIVGDGWSIAWRVHDAQFWGVAQRRRRISLVADFGGFAASEILFERKGLRGDSPQERETGQTAAERTGRGTALTDRVYALDRAYGNQGVNAKYAPQISDDGIAQTVVARGPGMVAYGFKLRASSKAGISYREGSAPTLLGQNMDAGVLRMGLVRRITPLECERLQGFPDGWTDIGEWIDSKGKKHDSSDSRRYKAIGNSIALPMWKWVLKRISAQYERDATMASLFDGIGGFPHLWEQINGKGSCVWASEVDEFCIAVTKVRIG